MRMHPRRFGAYSIAARFASAFTNEYYKNKKKKNNNNNGGNGCLIFIIIIIIILGLSKCASG